MSGCDPGQHHWSSGVCLNCLAEQVAVDGRRGPRPDAVRALIARGQRRAHAEGRSGMSEAGRAAMAAAKRVRRICPDCGGSFNDVWMKRHACPGRNTDEL